MKYLIIDKPQRVNPKPPGEYPYAVTRIIEELEKRKIEYDFAFIDDLELSFENKTAKIEANGKNLLEYTHILLRGHRLHKAREYETKRIIVDYIDQHNQKNPKKTIYVQNSETVKIFPYYNKIYTKMFCTKNDLPFLATYYRMDGNYPVERGFLKDFPLVTKEYAGINRIQEIDGKNKIKKNVYKVDNVDGFKQEFLKDMELKDYFIQEFSPIAEDARIFVASGKIIGGWKRKATESWHTVLRGEYTMYNKPEKEDADLVKKVAKAFKADFMAVDIMYKDGKPFLQEISLHPGFKAYETKIEGDAANIAEAIIEAFPKK